MNIYTKTYSDNTRLPGHLDLLVLFRLICSCICTVHERPCKAGLLSEMQYLLKELRPQSSQQQQPRRLAHEVGVGV